MYNLLKNNRVIYCIANVIYLLQTASTVSLGSSCLPCSCEEEEVRKNRFIKAPQRELTHWSCVGGGLKKIKRNKFLRICMKKLCVN